MKNFKIILTQFLILFFLFNSNSIIASEDGGGGSSNTNNNIDNIGNYDEAQMLDFVRGGGDIEDWFMDTFMSINENIKDYADEVSDLGQAIGGFGMLIYLAVIGFRMQEGDAWRVEPFIKPVILGLIIINWSSFVELVQKPFILLSHPAKEKFEEIKDEVDALRVEKYEKTKKVIDALYDLEIKNSEENDLGFAEAVFEGEISEYAEQAFENNILTPLRKFSAKLQVEVQNALTWLLTFVGLAILRCAVYGIFFIQIIWSMVLVIIGPIAVGMSLIPGFDNSFNNWLAKFINVNLYGFVGYIVVSLGQMLIIGSYEMEIHRIDAIIKPDGTFDEVLLANYGLEGGIFMSSIFTVVGYLVTAVGMFMVPTIADSIVSAGGAGIMSKAKSAGNMAKTGAKAIASKGTSLAKDVAKEAMKSGREIANSAKEPFQKKG